MDMSADSALPSNAVNTQPLTPTAARSAVKYPGAYDGQIRERTNSGGQISYYAKVEMDGQKFLIRIRMPSGKQSEKTPEILQRQLGTIIKTVSQCVKLGISTSDTKRHITFDVRIKKGQMHVYEKNSGTWIGKTFANKLAQATKQHEVKNADNLAQRQIVTKTATEGAGNSQKGIGSGEEAGLKRGAICENGRKFDSATTRKQEAGCRRACFI